MTADQKESKVRILKQREIAALLLGVTAVGFVGYAAMSVASSRKSHIHPKPVIRDYSKLEYRLPDRVSALNETYQDWRINCQKQDPGPRCALVQQLADEKSRQKILTLQFEPEKDKIASLVVMPFGLALTKGISIEADGKPVISAPFSTCMPHGCLVPFSLTRDQFFDLQAAKKLEIKAATPGSQNVVMVVSVKGLKEASARLAAMLTGT